MDAVAGTYVIEAVFVVKCDSEEDASELIESIIYDSGENPAIIDGMVNSRAPSVSTDCNFMTSKKRRLFFANG